MRYAVSDCCGLANIGITAVDYMLGDEAKIMFGSHEWQKYILFSMYGVLVCRRGTLEYPGLELRSEIL